MLIYKRSLLDVQIMSTKKQLMLVIAKMVSFASEAFHNLLSALKDMECTDMYSGLWQKNA